MFETDQDFFDSRDMIERIEELEALKEAAEDPDAEDSDREDFGEEEAEELQKLTNFAEGVSDSEWEFGMTFINDSHWEDYAQELCSDLGYLPNSLPGFISSNINWEGVATDLKVDYTSYELDGVTYWVR